MEGSWKSVRIVFYVFCFMFVFIILVFIVYYLINYKGSRKMNRVIDMLIRLYDEIVVLCLFCDELELVEILEKNGYGEFVKGKIFFLLRFIEIVEIYMVEKFFVIFLNCFVFIVN